MDQNGKAIYPAMVWMDKRCVNEVEELNELVGGNKIHEISGRPKDPCPCLYKIFWLKKHEPKIFQGLDKIIFKTKISDTLNVTKKNNLFLMDFPSRPPKIYDNIDIENIEDKMYDMDNSINDISWRLN